MGREKSKPKRVTFYGNGGVEYSLPNQNLLDGSVRILVNNQEVSAYVVNYTTGTIVFDSPKTDAQFIKVMYEFTNPIADFLPAARSRKSFIGGEFEWKPKRAGWQEPVVHRAQATYPAEAEISLPHTNAVVGSETVVLASSQEAPVPLERIVDYDLDYRDGRLRLKHPVNSTQNTIQIAYDYYEVQSQTETIIANDSKGPFYLASQHIVPHSVSIWLNNRVLMEHYDYTVSYYTGQVYFAYPIRHPDTITIQYETIRQHTRYGDANETENGFRIKASYMNEFVRADDAQFPSVTETVVASQNQLVLSHNPIDLTTVVVTDAGDNTVDINKDTSSAYSGIVRAASLSGVYSVTYQYRSSQQMIGILRLNQASGQTVVFASDVLGDALSLPALPVNYNSIQRVVVNPGRLARFVMGSHVHLLSTILH
ncbi:MAG: hypothetical protein EBY38_08395 [Flavobacteriaceae bacterium]|nr:hypothetical protein [Flavobacteriaceae bacterium]